MSLTPPEHTTEYINDKNESERMTINTNEFGAEARQRSDEETARLLIELGGGKITGENMMAEHKGNEQTLIRPKGMSLGEASKLYALEAKSMEEEHNFSHVFRFRPVDGAYHFQESLKELFGTGGHGKAIVSMFGTTPPEFMKVKIGLDEEVEVPWGRIQFPRWQANIYFDQDMDPVYGMLFKAMIVAPKKYGPEIRGFYEYVERRLKEQSIYKGKAIYGVGRVTSRGIVQPEFMDPHKVDRSKVAYRQEVFDILDNSVWGPIRNADVVRQVGIKLNRKTLLFGDYGTGKSLAGGITAGVAVDNGWTFIQAKTTTDDLASVLKTAELYAPALVFLEDINLLASDDDKAVSDLLEMFDGLGSKNNEVMVLMTTNHQEELPKGMMRPGRIDCAIHVDDLDAEGMERLLKGNVTEGRLGDDVDFDSVAEYMEGYKPAFVIGTFDTAQLAAINRSGSADFKLNEHDFKVAAESFRAQHDAHKDAMHAKAKDTSVGGAIEKVVGKQLDQRKIELMDSSKHGQIVVNPEYSEQQ